MAKTYTLTVALWRRRIGAKMTVATAIDEKIGLYLTKPFFRLQGFCTLLDANMLRSILVRQIEKGIVGNVAEIGVWHGKSFFVLAQGTVTGGAIFALDLFPTRPLARGERQQVDEFNENADKLGLTIPPESIVVGDSIDMPLEAARERFGPVRLFHVDGAHDYEHAFHDLEIAKAALADKGVLVMDDTFNVHWPEVTAATIDWMRDNREFAPWAATGQKLYLCRREYVALYQQMLKSRFQRELGRFGELLGDRYVVLSTPKLDMIAEKIKSKMYSPRQIKIPNATL